MRKRTFKINQTPGQTREIKPGVATLALFAPAIIVGVFGLIGVFESIHILTILVAMTVATVLYIFHFPRDVTSITICIVSSVIVFVVVLIDTVLLPAMVSATIMLPVASINPMRTGAARKLHVLPTWFGSMLLIALTFGSSIMLGQTTTATWNWPPWLSFVIAIAGVVLFSWSMIRIRGSRKTLQQKITVPRRTAGPSEGGKARRI